MKKRFIWAAIPMAVVLVLALSGCVSPDTTPASANANLKSLSVSSGVLAPAFAAATTAYTVSVPNGVESISVNAEVADTDKATLSQSPGNPVALTVGSGNVITVTVTAENADVKTYTVTVTREAPNSANAKLQSLTINGVSVENFSPDTETYTHTVPYLTESVTIAATAQETAATVTLPTPNPVALTVGSNNTITVTVQSTNGTAKTYTITITREAPSTNADLASLSVSSGTLNTAFAAGTTAYTVTVPNGVTSISVNAAVADTGKATLSQSPDNPVSLTVGSGNVITVTVTAEDGTTKKPYTITVTRQAAVAANAKLQSLTIDGASVENFSPDTETYTITVPFATTQVTVGATAQENVIPALPSPNPVSLNVGANPAITVTVTAPNGTAKKTYTITVTRQAVSNNANLASLSVVGGNLNETFAANTTSYTVTVPYTTASITVNAAKADTKANLVQSPANPVALTVGSGNVITVTVTAESGTTTKPYTVTVTREAASTNADLASLSVVGGNLNETFAAGTTAYTVTVPYTTASITVNAAVADTGKANLAQSPGTLGSPVDLTEGSGNVITVTVTAESGTPKVYTITVTRTAEPSSNADLQSISINGTAIAGFTADTAKPTATVNSDTATVKALAAHSGADVDYSPSNSITLDPGATETITITVTAEDGTTKKGYTLAITREVILVSSINVTPKSQDLLPDGTVQLNAAVVPDNADNTGITWTTSNPSLATVDSSGKVTAGKSAGKATITATAKDGSGISGQCVVTVKAGGKQVDVTFTGFNDQTIDLSGFTQDTLSKSNDDSLDISLGDGWDAEPIWSLDGKEIDITKSGSYDYFVYAYGLAIGKHTVAVVVYKDGVPYSKELKFRVVK